MGFAVSQVKINTSVMNLSLSSPRAGESQENFSGEFLVKIPTLGPKKCANQTKYPTLV